MEKMLEVNLSSPFMLTLNDHKLKKKKFMTSKSTFYCVLKCIITALTIFCFFHTHLFAQTRYFKFSDTIFKKEQIHPVVIYYNFSGGCGPRMESMITLDSIVAFLKQNMNIVIEIGAHTDYRGSENTNIKLTENRAMSLKDYMIYKGIDPSQIISKGYGESEPVIIDAEINKLYPQFPIGQVLDQNYIDCLNSVEEKEKAHSINRRTILKIIKNN